MARPFIQGHAYVNYKRLIQRRKPRRRPFHNNAPRMPRRLHLKRMSFRASALRNAQDALDQFYQNHLRLQPLSLDAPSAVKFFGVAFQDLRLARLAVEETGVVRQTGQNVSLLAIVNGAASVHSDGIERQLAPGGPIACARPCSTLSGVAHAGVGITLQLQAKTLITHAGALTGEHYDERLLGDMRAEIPGSDAFGAHLVQQAHHALGELAGLGGDGAAALAMTGYRESLYSFAAAALFPRVARAFEERARDVSDGVASKARDRIAENAAEPISLAALAEELGVSMRSLQEGFKRRYGLSPRAFLTECRLETARQLLSTAEPPLTVTEAAFASGFCDMGHFAAKFRRRFGVTPSEARRRARG
jgi:AraC-like DNA-binding protein